MLKQLFFVTTAGLAVCSSAIAEPTFMFGEGQASCGIYLDDRRTASEQQYVYVVWVRGFTSGFNYGTKGKQVSSGLDQQTILAYIDKYCRDKPLNGVAGAALSLVKELGGTK